MRCYFLIGLFPIIIACSPGQATSEKLENGTVKEENTEADSGEIEEDSGDVTDPDDTDILDIDDEDGDGVTPDEGDCDDSDPSIRPDALEMENGIDDNCNGLIDDGTNIYDDDGDGYTENDGDCDDSNAGISPNTYDVPDDGIDQDCDGLDLSCSNATMYSWIAEFPQVSACEWGQNGNAAATDGLFSARTEQHAIYTPPAEYTLCGVAPKIQKNQGGIFSNYFAYDDALTMTYNDRILFTTSDSFLSNLISDSLGYLYDWNDIIGANIFSGSLWKSTSDSIVNIAAPNAYFGGNFNVQIGDTVMNDLNSLSVAQGYADFGMVVFGDNDDYWNSQDGSDCFHTPLNFEVFVWLIEN